MTDRDAGEAGPAARPAAGSTTVDATGGRLAVGIDLGGTTLTGLLVRGDGGVVARRRRPTPRDDGETAVLQTINQVIDDLLSVAGRLPSPRVAGVGMGIPGPVDTDRGVCLFSPNLGWRNLDVAGYFREALRLPIRLDNDVRAATLGEAWLGAGRDLATFVCLTVGTGIGSGLVLGGRLWRGPGFSAGELGHIPVDLSPDAPRCGCGRRGCLEAVASATAISREASTAVARGEETVLAGRVGSRAVGGAPGSDSLTITARAVFDAARAGDGVARAIVERSARYLGFGIATAVNLFNPEAVIVGGGVARSWDLIGPIVESALGEHGFPPNLRTLRGIFPAKLGEDAGAIGAASLFLAPRE